MIIQATKYDKDKIIEMMKSFRAESPIADLYGEDNPEYWNDLLNKIFAGQGAVFLEEDKGLLLCFILPSIWNPKVLGLHELAWYVRPKFRGGFTGFRLLKAYLNYAKYWKEAGRIQYFTVSKMVSSPDIDYTKYGFRKIDENWIQ